MCWNDPWSNLYSKEYVEGKDRLLKKYVTKEFVLMFQDEVIKELDLPKNFLLGDDFMFESSYGVYKALKTVCQFYQAEEMIEFVDSIEKWYEYDDFVDTIGYQYAKKYKLYTPKKRYRNISKAKDLIWQKLWQKMY